MKILHTSDWHIGRTFHGHSTLEHLRQVFAALVELVRENDVDVVVVAGDVFDSSMPSAECFSVLSGVLRDIRAAGAAVVMTSGNHDSATRLGFQSEWAGLAGIHIFTRHDQYLEPVTIDDEYGPVDFYGIPYLEPSMLRHHHPEAELRTHEQALTFAMTAVRADAAARESRSVVVSHCFASGVAAQEEASDVERDITSGGLNLVPASVFDGPDYVALGHIHGRSTISDRVRYSGAPLHYSFGEAGKPRGGWLVELDAGGLDTVGWLDLPIPRRLSVLTGELDDLLGSDAFAGFEDDWVAAVITDQVRPMDAMRRLQDRFPHCATLEFRPSVTAETSAATYGERIAGRSDTEIVADFLTHVRNGVGPTEYETALVASVLTEQQVSS
ncbi:exonuclease SbcD [Conyzicola lurida]|uniref:Nuclease SbcCD subunit D n=1 Tax=Conyzicola lurida TaxID=1172621 RepID=A0A841ANC2_9MICO|nr:exonuclease SbcCD subunit D [Conyzicola lurida]MBB5843035.1 exonuclease SbcD [Conyzicola lurida]